MDIGISRADLEFEGLIAHPDIMSENQIVELKDTVSGKRLDITDATFKSYLRQLDCNNLIIICTKYYKTQLFY